MVAKQDRVTENAELRTDVGKETNQERVRRKHRLKYRE